MKTAYGMTMFFGRDDIPSNWNIGNPFFLRNVRFNVPGGPVHVIDEVLCHCGEMAMMVLKAALFGDLEVFRELLLTHDPKDIKALGRKVKPWNENVWLRHRKDVMLTVVLARARQDAVLRDWLLSTGDTEIVEASKFDRIWGAGLSEDDERISERRNWSGLNLLGDTYGVARRILREEMEYLISTNRTTLPDIRKVLLNERAKVKLTPYGATVYRRHMEDLHMTHRHPDGREIVEGDFYDFQFSDLMYIFGTAHYPGGPGTCFEGNALLVTPWVP